MKYSLIAVILLACLRFLSAQTLVVSELLISDDGIVSFSCMVSAHHSDREEYEISVYSSADNFEKELPVDINSVRPGVTLPVSFDGNQVIGDFDGFIEFDIQLSATTFPVQITSTNKKMKKGKEVTISWQDFHESGWYDIEIYQNDFLFNKLIANHRGTSFTTTLPKKMPKGEYELRVTPTNQQELFSEDYSVSIKSGKVGLIIGAGGALAGVVGALIILPIPPPQEEDLPIPPDLPGN